MMKHPIKETPPVGVKILACAHLEAPIHQGGEVTAGWQQEHEAAGYATAEVGEQRRMESGAWVTLLFMHFSSL